MTFSLKKNRRNTRSYSGSSTPAPSRSTASRPNTRNRTKPAREKRQFSLWSKLQGGRVQRFFCVLLLLAGLVAAVAGLCAGSIWLYGKATTSDFFATRHIDVAGNVRLSREMVLQYGGLKEGENSLAVSIAEVERKLRATPWVEEVSVKRLLPDRFVIKIKERMPTFWVHKDGVLYYANESGEAIAPVESRNFLSLPTLTVETGAEDDVAYLPRFMKDLHTGSLPVEAGAIASITVSPARGIEIYLEDREMRLSIATDDWAGNLARIGLTLGDLAHRHELKNVREVRSVNGSVWVTLSQPMRG